jgi:hypothetical protein
VIAGLPVWALGKSTYRRTEHQARTVRDLVEKRFRADRPEHQSDRRRLFRIAGRLAFIAGAEEDTRRRLDRALTTDELRWVLRRYPGD